MVRTLLLASLSLALSACGGDAQPAKPAEPLSAPPPGAVGTQATPQDKAPADENVTILHIPAQIFETRYDEGQEQGWKWRIKYPPAAQRHATLLKHLESTVNPMRDAFLAEAKAPREGDAAGAEWTFELEFDPMLENKQIVSLLGRGHSFSGGAHGMPLMVSATLDVAGDKVIGIRDWFAGERGLGRLSEYARGVIEAQRVQMAKDAGAEVDEAMLAELRAEIAKGTEANEQDLGLYHPMPGGTDKLAGLVLLFPPYQVASYAEGSFTVVVPAHMIYEYLKPEYQPWFESPAGAPTP